MLRLQVGSWRTELRGHLQRGVTVVRMQRAPHAGERVATMTTRSRHLICQRVRREFTASDAAELATRERSAMQVLRASDYFIVEAIATRFLSERW